MRTPTDEEVTQIILKQGPVDAEELARMAYPVRTVYLALMLSWAKEYGLDNLVERREFLRPVVLRGLEEVAEFITGFWRSRTLTDGEGRRATGPKQAGPKKKKGGKN